MLSKFKCNPLFRWELAACKFKSDLSFRWELASCWNRFLVVGYVVWECGVTNSLGLKNCCVGNGGTAEKFEDVSLVIFHLSSVYYRAHEKIGPPHIILVSDFSGLLVEQSCLQQRMLVWCSKRRRIMMW